MPRLPRLDLPGQFYHVFTRGVERRPIFHDSQDRTDFLGRLAQGLVKTGTLCFAWALLSNHFHLLVLSGAKGLAALMHPLLTGYAGYFNRRHQRVGHLVQNRYKALLCDEDNYFRELVRYIHLQPVRAGIVQTADKLAQYPWTGHPAMLDKIRLPWQAVDQTLGHFGSTRSLAQRQYESFLAERWNQGERIDLERGGLRPDDNHLSPRLSPLRERCAYDTRILGSGDFVEKIWQLAEKNDAQNRSDKGLEFTLEELQVLAAQTTGAAPKALLSRDRHRPESEARALLVYAATEMLGHLGADLARRLHMSSSSISAAVRRGRQLDENCGFIAKLRKRAI